MIELKKCSAQTHQGPYLQLNEDCYDFDLNKNIFMVLDGFGGSGVGDKCVSEIKENMKKFYGRVSVDPDSTLPFFFSAKYVLESNALINALLYTHKNVYKSNMTKEVNQRAGASGVFLVFSEELVCLSSIGNVMAYILRNGRIKPVFIPDNLELLSSDDEHEKFLKTSPLSGVGLFQDLHFQMKEIKIKEGDSLIIVSDGVYGRVEESEIAHSVTTQKESKDKINTLFNLSNSRGNYDNQTVMILDF